jgi:hypothetical protein
MGVDFFTCDHCGESICDAGDYDHCDCGKRFCSGPRDTGCGKVHENEDGSLTCSFCRREEISDYDLLQYLLAASNLTREEAAKMALLGRDMAAQAKKDQEAASG